MKLFTVLLFTLLISGCSSIQQNDIFLTLPELIDQYPLPVISESIYKNHISLDLQLLIDEDGFVRKAKLLSGSGNEMWDTLAIASIKKWRYSPALMNEKPIAIWLKQHVDVEFAEPIYLSLAEILCETKEQAHMITEALNNGEDFSKLAVKYSSHYSSKENGFIGKVDIQRYPREIFKALLKLKPNEYTSSMKYGQKYVIFKRIES